MSPAQQKRFYFPAWNRAAQEHEWVMRKGVLVGKRREFWESDELNQLYQGVWDCALARARELNRGVTAEDLRHGCHLVALGADKPSKALTNAETDRVVSLFNILALHDAVEALIEYLHPEESERKRLCYAIRHALPSGPDRETPGAYIHAVAKYRKNWAGFYREHCWDEMPVWALRQLLATLKERARSKQMEEPQMTPMNTDNEPF